MLSFTFVITVGPCSTNGSIAELSDMSGCYMNLFPSMRFPCEGEITSWSLHPKLMVQGVVYLGAWKILNESVYQLVGKNAINVSGEGLLKFPIPEGQRISVTKEHFVGLYLDRSCTDGLVSYSTDTQHDCVNIDIFEDDVVRLDGTIDPTVTGKSPVHLKRTVSVRAHVSQGMHSYLFIPNKHKAILFRLMFEMSM